MKKENWEIDVPVLCIFFARPEQFRQTFEQVKKARPRVLLLWQDGPRDGRLDDIENIMKCRKIAEDIDWECEIFKNYHDKNMGCDPSTHYSHKWAFSIVDRCIILEDDIVVSQSFFRFCKELLDKYEDDERIDRICGMNHLGKYKTGYDYLFCSVGSVWGWATWQRVAHKWESNYEFLDNKQQMDLTRDKPGKIGPYEKFCWEQRKLGVSHWERIVSYEMLLNSRLVIIPTVNMVNNVGLSANSTHASENIEELTKTVRKLFFMETFDLAFPLKHPPYVISDKYYIEKVQKIFYPKSRLIKLLQRLEAVWLRIKTRKLAIIKKEFK